MKTEAQISAFIAKGRNLAKEMQIFRELAQEYTATDAGNVITDADFTGINEGLVLADLTNFQTLVNEVIAVLDVAGKETVIQTYKAT